MQIIEASFEIVTPMFIGGGDNDVELRPPSIKGALRFWWRALHWGQCLQDANQNNSVALKLLHEREAALFGAAAKDKTERGQSPFFIKPPIYEKQTLESSWPTNNTGAGYLGYGLDKTKDHKHRQAIRPTQFSLCLVLKNTITPDQIMELKLTLRAWGLLGGLGSRSRRGFGSVNLTKLADEIFNFQDLEAYQQAIKSLINPPVQLAPSIPIFTALNQSMQIAVADNGLTHERLMDKLGNQYKTERLSVDSANKARAVFGLPLEGLPNQRDIENRRSSPLLLHIHKLTTGHIGVFTFIPAEFHPDYPEGKKLDFYDILDRYMNTMTRIYP
ncbi:MAG: type III-B CRISPR module RAMP protein Cmr1 [Methylococcales bacterium]